MKKKYTKPTTEMLEPDMESDILADSPLNNGKTQESKETSFDFEEQANIETEGGSYDWSK